MKVKTGDIISLKYSDYKGLKGIILCQTEDHLLDYIATIPFSEIQQCYYLLPEDVHKTY